MEMVVVKWLDAIRRDEVSDGDDLSPVEVKTIGWVLEHTSDHIALAHEWFPDSDEYRDVTTIPLPMVQSMLVLKERGGFKFTAPVEFEHTDPEAPYVEKGVECECARCVLALVKRRVEARETLNESEKRIAREQGWIPADSEKLKAAMH